MQANVYLFGDLGNGYTQYLDDYTKPLFKKFVTYLRANTQLFIHREDNTIYYSYIRRLTSGSSSDRYIGMCYAISGNLITDYEGLFRIFEGAITNLVTRGTILMFSSTGEVISNMGLLYKCKSEFSQISDYLQLQLGSLDSNKVFKLPPVDYSINTQEIKYFGISDSIDQIQKSIGVYAYVFITKDKNYDTESLHSYSCIIKENKKTIDKLENEKYELKTECNRLKRAQKRFKTVAWLSVILVIISIILINVASTSSQRADTISSQEVTIDGLETKVGNLYIDSARTHTTLKETINKLGYAQKLIEYKDDTLAVLRERNRDLIESLDYSNRQLKEQRKVAKEQSDLIQQRTMEIRSLKKRLENESFNPKGIDIQIYEGNKVKYLYTTSPWDFEGIDKRWKVYQLRVYYNGNLEKTQQIRVKR